LNRFARLSGPILVAFAWLGALASAAPITPTADETSRRQALASKLPGAKLLWVNEDRIFYSPIENFNPQLVTPNGATEGNPRWSPDGTRILFVRTPEGVFIMNADFSNSTLVIPGGNTASWTRDGQSITAVASDGYRVLKYDLGSGDTNTIFDSRDNPYNGQQLSQAAELRNGGRFLLTFRVTPEHVTEIVDLQEQTYISNAKMERGDCSPAWAPDGSYLLTTARTSNRPVLKTDFNPGGPSVSDSLIFVAVDDVCECSSYYIHGQRVSNDGAWVAVGAKIFDGPKSNGTREIWIWEIGEPLDTMVRMTFDTAEDQSPSLYVPGGGCQNGAQRDCYTGPGGTENEGECHGGTEECTDGSWGSCQDQSLPVAETCSDNLDNDCDGLTDQEDVQDCPVEPDGGDDGGVDGGFDAGPDAGPDAGDEPADGSLDDAGLDGQDEDQITDQAGDDSNPPDEDEFVMKGSCNCTTEAGPAGGFPVLLLIGFLAVIWPRKRTHGR
jgi:hypothetical protein